MQALAAAIAALLAAGAVAVGARTGAPPLGSDGAVSGEVARAATLDAALGGERSLLAFLPPDVTGGTYEVIVDKLRPPRHRGVFWRTPAGNAYTRLQPYDAAFVTRTVEPLVRRLTARVPDGQTVSQRLRALVPLYAGPPEPHDELQWSFERAVYHAVLHPTHGNALTAAEKEECGRAMAEHERAAREAVSRTQPAFAPASRGTERWTLDVVALRTATSATRHAAELACDTQRDASSPDDSGATATVTRSVRGVTVELTRPGTWRQYAVRVRPGDPGPPPARPRPAPADDLVQDFLAAVNACRALPWEWSNFAAGNDYTGPHERDYDGPTVFSQEWYCAADLPENR